MAGGQQTATLERLAAEQLYDELLARHWALQSAMNGGRDDIDARFVAALDATALRLIAAVSRETTSAHELLRYLHPISAPHEQDPWWNSPPGRLLDSSRRTAELGRILA